MEGSEGEVSEGDHTAQQNIQSLPGGKFYRQMSEQARGTPPNTSRTNRNYPPKETSPVSAGPDSSPTSAAVMNANKPKPPERSKVQVATLEVHNVKKAINRSVHSQFPYFCNLS